MVRVLITGGAGFIGINLVKYLLNKTNWKINILDNLVSGKLEDLKNLKEFSSRCNFIEGDIRNENKILEAIKNCDYVINLAAQTGVITSIKDPIYDAEVNILGTIKILQACINNKIKKLVHASSAASLGKQKIPLTENKIPQPISPYGASKLAAEAYCSAFSEIYSIKTIVLRFSNVYGPYSYEKGSVIPLFIKQMLNKQPIIIYGSGTQTRDFIYVEDVCNAIYISLAGELPSKYNLFQIGTGRETSINTIYKLLKKELEMKGIKVLDPIYKEKRSGEILRSYADISRSVSLLGFKPNISLKEGLRKTIAWFLKRKYK